MKRGTALVKVAVLLYVWGCGYTDAQDTCPSVRVRLRGITGVSFAGRVEVCVEGQWGAVCNSDSNQWSLKNAQVVCKELGYSVAINSLPQDHLPEELQAGPLPIIISEVECNGIETSLLRCPHSTTSTSCTRFTVAAIVCKEGVGVATPGDVRLVGDTADYRGAVEYYNQFFGWTGVCADSAHSSSWTSNIAAAEVVCAQLGYEGGRPFSQSINSLSLDVADLECEGNDFSLSDCSDNRLGTSTRGCASQEAGWVECRRTDEEDFSVRLVGGSREGIVEVALYGRWGTICEDQEWDVDNAEVICEELGQTSEGGYSTTPSGSYIQYLSAMQPIWLSMVSCQPGDTIDVCKREFLLGYTTCNAASSTSVFNSAEANCGSPPPSPGLSGGQVTGIVIGSIAVIVLFVLACIYLPDYWKKRHTYPLWRKLTTPSRWCGNCNMLRNTFHRQQRRAPVGTTSRNQTAPHPAQRPAPSRTAGTGGAAPQSRATGSRETSAVRSRGERVEGGVSGNASSSAQTTPPPPEPKGDLTAAPPPSYQAAVSYLTASEDVLKPPPPPAYTPSPDPSAAYPPPIPSDPSAAAYPPPIPSDPSAAYPPPIPDPSAAYPPPIPSDPLAAYPLSIPFDPSAAYPPPIVSTTTPAVPSEH